MRWIPLRKSTHLLPGLSTISGRFGALMRVDSPMGSIRTGLGTEYHNYAIEYMQQTLIWAYIISYSSVRQGIRGASTKRLVPDDSM